MYESGVPRMRTRYIAFWTATFLASSLQAQETRSMIFGRMLDPQGSAVAGAAVSVTNTDTNVTLPLRTNDTGYYEANLLLPGSYQVTTEVAGFKDGCGAASASPFRRASRSTFNSKWAPSPRP